MTTLKTKNCSLATGAPARMRPRPSDAVRAAILAESRRVAAELAKREAAASPSMCRVLRPTIPRWKITAFGTVGAALLAALLFAPRYLENAPPAQVNRVARARVVGNAGSGQGRGAEVGGGETVCRAIQCGSRPAVAR